ncbi:MAG: hypothetical protein AAB503_02240 [Patescibacteria group bacterium]
MAEKKLFPVTGDQFIDVDTRMSDIKRQLRLGLRGKNASPLDPGFILDTLQDIDEVKSGKNKRGDILKLISGAEQIIIPPTNGARMFVNAEKVFTNTYDFKGNSRLNKPAPATEKTPVHVYEIVRDTTFRQMFRSLGVSADLNKPHLTQDQIIAFAETHRNWLGTVPQSTFFISSVGNYFFVVLIQISYGTWGPGDNYNVSVYINSFKSGDVLDARDRNRLVIAQLQKPPVV